MEVAFGLLLVVFDVLGCLPPRSGAGRPMDLEGFDPVSLLVPVRGAWRLLTGFVADFVHGAFVTSCGIGRDGAIFSVDDVLTPLLREKG